MKLLSIIYNGRFFVFTGVFLTVVSALITNYIIKENNKKISEIQKKITGLEVRIDQQWQTAKDLERRQDFATVLAMLSGVSGSNKATLSVVSDYLNQIFKDAGDVNDKQGLIKDLADEKIGKKWLKEIFSKVDGYKKATINEINDLYGEKIDLEEEKREIENRNSFLSGIALFLQIMGMILVLSRRTV